MHVEKLLLKAVLQHDGMAHIFSSLYNHID